MIDAERGAKVSWTDLNSLEDVATSYLFGLMRYLPVERGLGRFVRLALRDASMRAPKVSFWPLRDGTEPDVLIEDDEWMLLVEAKVGAGFGENQLGREWRFLLDAAERTQSRDPAPRPTKRRLALVTLTRAPQEVSGLSQRVDSELTKLASSVRRPSSGEIVSLTWSAIARRLLEEGDGDPPEHAAVLDDLRFVLERRGLFHPPFDGWPAATRLPSADPAWYLFPSTSH